MLNNAFFQTLSTIVVTEKRERAYSYLDLIRTPKMRKLALCTGIVWSVCFMVLGCKTSVLMFGLQSFQKTTNT